MDIEKGLDKLIEIVQRETHCIVNNSPMELKHHTDRAAQKEIIIKTFEDMRKRIAELEAYADKLAAGLPEGMLPKDVENLRDANAWMADRIAVLMGENISLKRKIPTRRHKVNGLLVELSCENCRHEEVDENLWEPCLSCRAYSEWELKFE